VRRRAGDEAAPPTGASSSYDARRTSGPRCTPAVYPRSSFLKTRAIGRTRPATRRRSTKKDVPREHDSYMRSRRWDRLAVLILYDDSERLVRPTRWTDRAPQSTRRIRSPVLSLDGGELEAARRPLWTLRPDSSKGAADSGRGSVRSFAVGRARTSSMLVDRTSHRSAVNNTRDKLHLGRWHSSRDASAGSIWGCSISIRAIREAFH